MEGLQNWFQDRSANVVLSVLIIVIALVGWWIFRRYGARTITMMASRVSDKHAMERAQRAETLWTTVRRLGALFWVLAIVITLLSIWDVPITGLVAVGSVVGVAIGFGAQSLVQDVIAGFFIIVEDQYGIGDVVDVGGVSGTVEDIQLRVTVLRELNGVVHYVPNGQIKVASNRTQDYSQIVLDVGVAYGTDVDAALGVMQDELAALAADEEWSEVVLEPPEVLGVNELGESAVILRGLVKALPDDRWRVKREVHRRIMLRFDAEGIEVPFPQLEARVRTIRTPR